MSRSQLQSIISSDDDDYELPSLSDRIKASFKTQHISRKITSDSENEDVEFQKFSERIRNTPCSQVRYNSAVPSENKKSEMSQFLKFSEETHTPKLNMKLDFSLTSDSENEEADILNYGQKLNEVHAPKFQRRVSSYETNESDSDGTFSNLAERLCEMQTPMSENKENYCIANESDTDEEDLNFHKRVLEFRTPLSQNRKNCTKVDDPESDESFSNFLENLRTPMSMKKIHLKKVTNSESDESFSNFRGNLRTPMSMKKAHFKKVKNSESDESFSDFLEKLHTPMSMQKKKYEADKSDSDDSFINSAGVKLLPFHTPMSQRKCQRKDSFLSPPISAKIKQCTPTDAVKKKGSNTENEKEFTSMFPPKTINSTFLYNRASCTKQLFEFFNKKIFNSQLPHDMPLIWDCSLIKTAGLTFSVYKNGVYSSSIKLSYELLNSFDRLRSTLLHEMCHAAVWIINKQSRVRHGPLWQIWASRCKLILPFVDCPVRCHNYEVAYRVWYRCITCNWKRGTCKRVKKYEGAVCKWCKTPITMTFA